MINPTDLIYTEEQFASIEPKGDIVLPAGGRNLLIAGIASDGPQNVVISDSQDVYNKYGYVTYEKIAVTSGMSTYTLSACPEPNTLTAYVQGYNRLEEYYLDNMGVTGTTMEFMATGEDFDMIVGYVKIDSGGLSSNLLRAYNEIAPNAAGSNIYLLRVGGVHANITVGGFEFSSVYPGALYNGISFTLTDSRLSIDPLPGKGPGTIYNYTGYNDLIKQVNGGATFGRSPLTVKLISPYETTITSGTYTLSGGADGTITEDTVEAIMNMASTLPIDVLYIAGALDTLYNEQILSLLRYFDYPTLVVVPSAIVGDSNLDEYVEMLPTYTVGG